MGELVERQVFLGEESTFWKKEVSQLNANSDNYMLST